MDSGSGAKNKIRVLIVDDSAMMRALLRRALQSQPDIEVADVARDGREALDKVAKCRPDVVTLDIEMPGTSGIEVLERIMKNDPRPVVMVSTLTQVGAEATFESLEKGAVDYVPKPLPGSGATLQSFAADVVQKVRAAAASNLKQLIRQSLLKQRAARRVIRRLGAGAVDRFVAIGISAGGPASLCRMLPLLPADFVPVAIAQHMPPQFTGPFARRLDSLCSVHVKEAEDGEPFERGKVLIAPGDYHLKVRLRAGKPVVQLDRGPKVSGFRPSVDVLFRSVAEMFGPRAIAVIMTGMGRDGADGIKAVKAAGGVTIAQDQATSVVYGMPKAAVETGCVDVVCGLMEIPEVLANLVSPNDRATAPSRAAMGA